MNLKIVINIFWKSSQIFHSAEESHQYPRMQRFDTMTKLNIKSDIIDNNVTLYWFFTTVIFTVTRTIEHSGSIPRNARLPRKRDYRTDTRTDGQQDTRQSDPYVPLCFAGDTKMTIMIFWSELFLRRPVILAESNARQMSFLIPHTVIHQHSAENSECMSHCNYFQE